MNKSLLYRQDGYLFALLFLQEHTLDELEEEIRLREKTGIKTVLTFADLNVEPGLTVMTNFIQEAHNVMWCVAMRRMGFGKGRILRNLERVKDRQPATIQEALQFRDENDRQLVGILKDKRFDREALEEHRLSRTVEEYVKCREEGLKFAVEVVRDKGKRGLTKLIARTNYNKNLVLHEIDHANDIIRGIYNEAKIMEWLVSLHELEKFGDSRMNKCMDEFEKAYTRIMNGQEGYENYLEEIEQVTGVRLSDQWLKDDDHYPRVAHKKKKPKKKKPKAPEPLVELPPIEEPVEYTAYPCPGCLSKERCRSVGYQKECTCLELYKEVRRENIKKNTA